MGGVAEKASNGLPVGRFANATLSPHLAGAVKPREYGIQENQNYSRLLFETSL
jgi:hypothetical protein